MNFANLIETEVRQNVQLFLCFKKLASKFRENEEVRVAEKRAMFPNRGQEVRGYGEGQVAQWTKRPNLIYLRSF